MLLPQGGASHRSGRYRAAARGLCKWRGGVAMTPLAHLRVRRNAEAIHRLGARSLYELLLELGKRTGQERVIEEVVADFATIDPDLLGALGGDCFPSGPVRRIV